MILAALRLGAPKDTKFQDYKVDFLREEYIASVALDMRKLSGEQNYPRFNIVDFYKRYLIGKPFGDKGILELVKMVEGALSGPAFVKYKPFRVHVCEDVLEVAAYGSEEARFILAHEIGHILFHDHNAKSFSKEELRKPTSELQNVSAEWQADTFGRHFLMPMHVAKSFHTAKDLAQATQSPILQATRQFDFVNRPNKEQRAVIVARATKSYTGDFCSICNNATLVRSGTFTKCDTCGAKASS